MSEAIPKSRWTTLKAAWVVYLAAAIIAVCTVAVHALSYSWSPMLALFDVEATFDEGLASLLVPFVRIPEKATPVSTFVVYERRRNGWSAGVAGKTPLRHWMNTFPGRHSAMFAGFGYWVGDWQSKSRPGPFIVVFVPIWFLGVATFAAFLAVYFRWIRFGLRALFVLMTLSAVLLFVLRLRSG